MRTRSALLAMLAAMTAIPTVALAASSAAPAASGARLTVEIRGAFSPNKELLAGIEIERRSTSRHIGMTAHANRGQFDQGERPAVGFRTDSGLRYDVFQDVYFEGGGKTGFATDAVFSALDKVCARLEDRC